jgi:hypothetical protein
MLSLCLLLHNQPGLLKYSARTRPYLEVEEHTTTDWNQLLHDPRRTIWEERLPQ